ncbi:MAG TPA: right-handed parallel beta-helix repeat-containing protein [Thermoanaerobaculia bacterium]|nr:right-handed parallel beta-helix repeat-containing protein [Thermoanaerobaculia bacterium]
MTRLFPLLALLLAVPVVRAEDVVLEKGTSVHPVITLKEGQTLRGADPNVHPVVSGIVLAKNVTVSGIDIVASGGTAIKGGEGTIVIENASIRGASNRGIDIDGATSITIRNVQIAESATRDGVSAATCAGDPRGNSIAPCNAALFLRNDGNVLLEKVVIDGSAQLGIAAEDIGGLRMNDVEVKNAGNESSEGAVVLRNVGGDVALTNCRFHDSSGRELVIENGKGDARVRIEHGTFTHPAGAKAPAQQAMLAEVSGNASLSVDVTGSTFDSGGSTGLQANAVEHGKLTLHLAQSTFDHNGGAVLAGASESSTLDYTISGNTIRRSSLGAIDVAASGSSVVHGAVAKNDIAGAEGCGGCIGIRLTANTSGQLTSSIDDNGIRSVEGEAVRVVAGDNSDVRIAVTKNRTAALIHVQAGTRSKDSARICADVRDNTAGQITVWNRFPGTTVKLSGFAGDPKSIAAVAAYLGRTNHGAKGEAKLTTDPAGNAFAPGEHCVTP